MFFQTFSTEIDELPAVLAEKVPLIPEVLQTARADSTTKSYFAAFHRWRLWASSNSVKDEDILPAKPFIFSIYLCSLIQSANSPSPVLKAFYSVKYVHDLLGFVSPTESLLVKNILESAKRRLSNCIVKKEPVTVKMLGDMFDRLYEFYNLKSQRTICACLIAYAGFLRSAELLNIRRSDIVIDSSHLSIFIESSKTDQYREGARVVIARTGTKLCPVVNLEKYFCWADFVQDTDTYIFCRIVFKKGLYHLRNTDKHISYTTLREIFIEAFKPHVPDINLYGFHSLRSGGATSAANNGIKDRLFKRHGRWKSENAKDGYIKDSLNERLVVSQSLGL